MERLIELAPPPSAFTAALLRIPGLGGDSLPSPSGGTVACARLGYRFATATGNAGLVAITGNLLLGVLGQTGQNAEGIALAHELLDAVKEPFPKIQIQSMLGNLYHNSGRPLAGISVLDQAAQAIKKVETNLEDDVLAVLETHVHNNLAVIHLSLGDLAKQRVALDRAYISSHRLRDQGFRLSVLLNLGGYYLAVNDVDSGERCLREILEAKAVPPELRMKAGCEMARVHYQRGELDRAEAEAQQAVDAARKAEAHRVEALALRYLAYVADKKNKREECKALLKAAVEAARRAGDDGLVITAEILLADAELMDNSGSDRGYELLRSAGRRALARRDALELLEQGRGLHRSVKELADRIIEQAMARGRVEEAWQACEAARAHLLLKQMAARQHAKSDMEVTPPDLGAVRAALASLGPNAVMIGYHIGEERSWLFIVRPLDPMTVVPLDMTSSRLMTLFRAYDREVRRFQTFGDIGEQWLQEAAPLVTPLEPHLRPGDYLIVVPSGFLFALPWHAMTIGGFRIGQRWPVSYVPAAALLLVPGPPRGRPGSRAVLAPVFKEEAEMVGRILDAPIVRDGTKQDYLAAFSSADLIHVSMHGAFSSARPEMSGLVVGDLAPLAAFYSAAAKPPHARSATEDAILRTADELKKHLVTANDLEAVELRQHAMVVLSACESGLSRIDEAADPVGLVRALMLSGAETIVATFWRVEPSKTADLMRLFYEALSDSTEPLWDCPAEALRRAQVALAAKSPHPFYWAPFYVIGGLHAGCAQRLLEKTYAVDC